MEILRNIVRCSLIQLPLFSAQIQGLQVQDHLKQCSILMYTNIYSQHKFEKVRIRSIRVKSDC